MTQEQTELWKDIYSYIILMETGICSGNYDFDRWAGMLRPLSGKHNSSTDAITMLTEAYEIPCKLYKCFKAEGKIDEKELNPDHRATTLMLRDAYRYFDGMYTDYTVNRTADPVRWAERLKELYEKHGCTVAAECILRGSYMCFAKKLRKDLEDGEAAVRSVGKAVITSEEK